MRTICPAPLTSWSERPPREDIRSRGSGLGVAAACTGRAAAGAGAARERLRPLSCALGRRGSLWASRWCRPRPFGDPRRAPPGADGVSVSIGMRVSRRGHLSHPSPALAAPRGRQEGASRARGNPGKTPVPVRLGRAEERQGSLPNGRPRAVTSAARPPLPPAGHAYNALLQ